MVDRAFPVEPDEQGRWYADLSPVSGPKPGPFYLRSQALEVEQQWLTAFWLRQSDSQDLGSGSMPSAHRPA